MSSIHKAAAPLSPGNRPSLRRSLCKPPRTPIRGLTPVSLDPSRLPGRFTHERAVRRSLAGSEPHWVPGGASELSERIISTNMLSSEAESGCCDAFSWMSHGGKASESQQTALSSCSACAGCEVKGRSRRLNNRDSLTALVKS